MVSGTEFNRFYSYRMPILPTIRLSKKEGAAVVYPVQLQMKQLRPDSPTGDSKMDLILTGLLYG